MDTDNELVVKVQKESCEASITELVRRHAPLCGDVFRRYMPTLKALGLSYEDLLNEIPFVVYRAASSFNPTKKSKFSTWLANNVRYYCLNYINHNKNQLCHVDMAGSVLTSIPDKDPGSDADISDYVFEILGRVRDKRIQKIFLLKYKAFQNNKKISWSTIGQKLGISTQTAINLHKKGKKILKHKLHSVECFDTL